MMAAVFAALAIVNAWYGVKNWRRSRRIAVLSWIAATLAVVILGIELAGVTAS